MQKMKEYSKLNLDLMNGQLVIIINYQILAPLNELLARNSLFKSLQSAS